MPSQMPGSLNTLPLPLLLQKNPLLCMDLYLQHIFTPITIFDSCTPDTTSAYPQYMFVFLGFRFIRTSPFLHVPCCTDLISKISLRSYVLEQQVRDVYNAVSPFVAYLLSLSRRTGNPRLQVARQRGELQWNSFICP